MHVLGIRRTKPSVISIIALTAISANINYIKVHKLKEGEFKIKPIFRDYINTTLITHVDTENV